MLPKPLSLVFCLLIFAIFVSLPVNPPSIAQSAGEEERVSRMGSGDANFDVYTLDSIANLMTGWRPSLVIDPKTNHPYISYANSNGEIMLAYPVTANGNCGPNNTWKCTAVAQYITGGHSSIDIYYNPDSQFWRLGIVYRRDTAMLNYITTTNLSSWEMETISSSTAINVSIGKSATLKYDSQGIAHVSYYHENNNTGLTDALKYAKRVNGNCGTGNKWTCAEIDSGEGVGAASEMDMIGDTPLIAYYDEGNTDLLFAQYIGSVGPYPCGPDNFWSCITYDTNGGADPSIAAKGGLRIAYHNESNGYLQMFVGPIYPIDHMGNVAGKDQGLRVRVTSSHQHVMVYSRLRGDDQDVVIARPYQDEGLSQGNCGLINGSYRYHCATIDSLSGHDMGRFLDAEVNKFNQVVVAYTDEVGSVMSLKVGVERLKTIYLPLVVKP
ncbi:MAG: hypothetical protein ACOYYS_22570 [Chloroflexota bacterium]